MKFEARCVKFEAARDVEFETDNVKFEAERKKV